MTEHPRITEINRLLDLFNGECYCDSMDENNSGLGFTKACNMCWARSICEKVKVEGEKQGELKAINEVKSKIHTWVIMLDSPEFIGTDANIVRNEMIEEVEILEAKKKELEAEGALSISISFSSLILSLISEMLILGDKG